MRIRVPRAYGSMPGCPCHYDPEQKTGGEPITVDTLRRWLPEECRARHDTHWASNEFPQRLRLVKSNAVAFCNNGFRPLAVRLSAHAHNTPRPNAHNPPHSPPHRRLGPAFFAASEPDTLAASGLAALAIIGLTTYASPAPGSRPRRPRAIRQHVVGFVLQPTRRVA